MYGPHRASDFAFFFSFPTVLFFYLFPSLKNSSSFSISKLNSGSVPSFQTSCMSYKRAKLDGKAREMIPLFLLRVSTLLLAPCSRRDGDYLFILIIIK